MIKKRIAIFCVNYNSYNSLFSYLASIDEAAGMTDVAGVDVFVADNSQPNKSLDYKAKSFSLKVVPTGENKGYFGAIHYLMGMFSPLPYDYCIISNVDVLLPKDFFTTLLSQHVSNQVGWIAPQIYSEKERRDRNPKILHRYPKGKLQVLHILFSMPLLYNLYTHTLYKSKKFIDHEPGPIYAGHGSFIILTKRFFEECGIIDYPVFLFCEEIYLGEQCKNNGLEVIYQPAIKVIDGEHVSTGNFRKSLYCKLNYKAIGFILKTYY